MFSFFKSLLKRPIYFMELFFVGAPFFFLQVLVFGIAYMTYGLILSGGVGSFRFSSDTIAQYFDFTTWFLLAPIIVAIIIKLISLGLKREVVLHWWHWFWSFTAIDTFFYVITVTYLAYHGVFANSGGGIGLLILLGLYVVTVLFTLLHFYLYDKIGREDFLLSI